jgi:prepilin-type N-terminal cleavage/methylation domain-containing protein
MLEIKNLLIKNKNHSGFTLVEVLITVVVLAVGCLAASRLLVVSLKGFNLADNMTAAVFLAEAEMERLKSLPHSKMTYDAEHTPVVVTNNLNRLGQTCTPPNCQGYIFNRTVSYFRNAPTTFSNHVEIVVDWTDSNGPHNILYTGAITTLSF